MKLLQFPLLLFLLFVAQLAGESVTPEKRFVVQQQGSPIPDSAKCVKIGCANEGESCSGTLSFQDGKLTCLGSMCCKQNLNCVADSNGNRRCLRNNLGFHCSVDGDCKTLPWALQDPQCVSESNDPEELKICKVYRNARDTCSNATQCYGYMSCVNKVCQPLLEGEMCHAPKGIGYSSKDWHTECDEDLFCKYNKTSGTDVCSKVIPEGEACDVENMCGRNCYCHQIDQVCTPLYSVGEGGSCTEQNECGLHLACDPVTRTCLSKITQKYKECSSDLNCKASISSDDSTTASQRAALSRCTCHSFVGQKRCDQSKALPVDPCRSQRKFYHDCTVKHKCNPAFESGTCSYQHCINEFTELSSCECTSDNKVSGSCTFFQMCPRVSAKETLIVVAIGLFCIGVVLGVVFCLLLKVKTRKDYSRARTEEYISQAMHDITVSVTSESEKED